MALLSSPMHFGTMEFASSIVWLSLKTTFFLIYHQEWYFGDSYADAPTCCPSLAFLSDNAYTVGRVEHVVCKQCKVLVVLEGPLF
mmetsp:Transcript_18760/g.29904  ORF Transcript_18760/g.29904 Transcript_18760/m.29904 type:complete len:85 (+) Transcript_18760:128-382(+)